MREIVVAILLLEKLRQSKTRDHPQEEGQARHVLLTIPLLQIPRHRTPGAGMKIANLPMAILQAGAAGKAAVKSPPPVLFMTW